MTPPTIEPGCAETIEALAAYALGLVDADEGRVLDAHLQTCPGCRASLAHYDRVVGAFGAGAALPPAPALRRRLLAEIVGLDVPAHPDDARRRPMPRGADVVWWRATAGLALVATLLLVGLGAAVVLLRQTQADRADARDDRRQIVDYLRRGGTMVALVPAPGMPGAASGQGSLVVAPDQPQALLVVAGFAPADASHHYRAWVERAGRRTWVGELEVAADGTGYLLAMAPAPLVTYDEVGFSLVGPGSAGGTDLLMAAVPGGRAPPGDRTLSGRPGTATRLP